MPYSGLSDFIEKLEKNGELLRITTFTAPLLEITEITDRITKTGEGKALLFTNNGTSFPLLINAFGSEQRMTMALSMADAAGTGAELEKLFSIISSGKEGFFGRLSSFPSLVKAAGFFPSRKSGKGSCQAVVHRDPDLNILPVLKCWPYDGGRFITLPMVHTIHPETGMTNVGMYRMQVLDSKTTAMHWQRHKTGANHFEAWKRTGQKMPVSVALGGDPVYTYAATAPLPENINEYILAGFLRKRKVKLVRCLTNSLFVPADADIVIEGYVDPSEDPVWEGPFGDHTGFYSLADWYPRFHVTCITHARNAVYPATIVGIPPQEDAFLARTTERIFLYPVKLALQPEIIDFHMPDAGVAHNLLVVKIDKTYPGQGMKVINSLSGAGQMMFTKYIIVVDGDVNIRDYRKLVDRICENTDPQRDIFFSHGPLDVLDHSSDSFSFGGKAGIDATIKHPEELQQVIETERKQASFSYDDLKEKLLETGYIHNVSLNPQGVPVIIVSVNQSGDIEAITKTKQFFRTNIPVRVAKFIFAVDNTVDVDDLFMVTWQILANSDPLRDHELLPYGGLFIDGTIKAFRKGGFPRRWPNVVVSAEETIALVDRKWESLGAGDFIDSPSLRYSVLKKPGKEQIDI